MNRGLEADGFLVFTVAFTLAESRDEHPARNDDGQGFENSELGGRQEAAPRDGGSLVVVPQLKSAPLPKNKREEGRRRTSKTD